METKNRDDLVCKITNEIIENNISSFADLLKLVTKKYGDEGIIVISIKTSYFKELVDSNYRDWKDSV